MTGITVRARCADGPYVGQIFRFTVPPQKIHPNRFSAAWVVGPLVWIVHGGDRHCYSLVKNTQYGGWRLVYRDTF